MKLLLYPAVEPERLEKIRAAAPSVTVTNAADEQQALREAVDADGFIGRISPEMLLAAQRLRWIQAPTVSLEHYVFPELVEHPAVLTNMRGLFSDNIADQVMGYIICFARQLHTYIRNQVAAKWAPVGGEHERVGMGLGPSSVTAIDAAHLHVADLTLGIVGLGSIGSELARRAKAFDMRIIAVDPRRDDAPPEVEAIWRPDELPRLLQESDVVVIAAPHTPETEKWFRRSQFQHMKKSAYFINIGRGAIVDLSDLCDALQAGEIAGAALDVYEKEPLPADHRLWKMPNVILTPHIAGYSPRIADRHLGVLLDNVQRFARGEPLVNVADKRAWC